MHVFYSATILGFSVYLTLWLFLIYSFLGVLIEGIFCLVRSGALEARLGLLYLPLRPIYGFGGAACTLFLAPLMPEPILVFLLAVLICSVVEYVASLVTEKAFGTISWDYSDKPLNLSGRVCLHYSIAWGLLALLAVYVLDQYVYGLVNPSEGKLGELVLTVVMVLMLLSVLLTVAALARTRRRVDELKAEASGEEQGVSDPPWGALVGRLVPDCVLINSFPRMSLATELMELTDQPRAPIRLSGRPSSPKGSDGETEKSPTRARS